MKKRLHSTEVNGLFGKGMLSVVKPLLKRFLPTVFSELLKVQMPVEKGGLKAQDDDAIVVLIVQEGEKVLLNVHPLKWIAQEDIKGYLLKKPIRSTNISDLLQGSMGINMVELFEEAQIIDDTPINEEE